MTAAPPSSRGGALSSVLRQSVAPGLPRWRTLVAAFIGLIIGCSPLFGLHLLLAIVAARAFRLNLLLVYGAANISIPPMVPILGFVSVQLGSFLRRGAFLPLDRSSFATMPLGSVVKRFFADWLVGGLVLGAILGVALCVGIVLLSLLTARWRARPRSRRALLREAIDRTIDRRGGFTRPAWWEAWLKMRLDPCHRVAARFIPPRARLLDLGAGSALFASAAAELGDGRSATCVERDERTAAMARKAALGLPVSVISGDIRVVCLDGFTVIAMLDALHYMPVAEQDDLLTRAARSLPPGGRVLVREHDAGAGRRGRITRWAERWALALGRTRAEGLFFRPIAELEAILQQSGMRVRRVQASWCLLPGNILLCGRAPGKIVQGEGS